MRTSFSVENAKSGASDTTLTQETPESEGKMKFPKPIKHRGRTLATIYGKTKAYPRYRAVWYVSGKRVMKAFERYGGEGGALAYAERLVKDLAKGSQVTALSPGQAMDALAAFDRLQAFYTATGRKVSLLGAVSELAEAYGKLRHHSLGEAVDGFLRHVASIHRKDIGQAVEDFITSQEARTKAEPGKRPQLSLKHFYNQAIHLRRFAGAFPNTAVCDLTKEHIGAFIAGLATMKTKSRNGQGIKSAKARNHHRAEIQHFLGWAVSKDYLSPDHRLGEAAEMKPERANNCEIEFYTPSEFKAMLEAAQGPMQAIIAIGGMAGLRTAELLRMTWEDTRRVAGHIEVTAQNAKTRARRLIETCPALAQWLAPFANHTGLIWTGHEVTFQQHLGELCDQAKVKRKPNGLRHAFATYHFALHSNENLTAAVSGNSPSMVHGHYRGLATKPEAEAWFGVSPAQPVNVIQLAQANE